MIKNEKKEAHSKREGAKEGEMKKEGEVMRARTIAGLWGEERERFRSETAIKNKT